MGHPGQGDFLLWVALGPQQLGRPPGGWWQEARWPGQGHEHPRLTLGKPAICWALRAPSSPSAASRKWSSEGGLQPNPSWGVCRQRCPDTGLWAWRRGAVTSQRAGPRRPLMPCAHPGGPAPCPTMKRTPPHVCLVGPTKTPLCRLPALGTHSASFHARGGGWGCCWGAETSLGRHRLWPGAPRRAVWKLRELSLSTPVRKLLRREAHARHVGVT